VHIDKTLFGKSSIASASLSSLKNNELTLIIDCCVSDFFYQINASFSSAW